jgi:pimeloyl-ACP methyl ester carboxylesterase
MGPLEILARALGTLAVLAAALMLLLYAFKGRLLFRPDSGPHLTGPPPGSGLESLFLDGLAGARIEAWTAPPEPGARTVMLFHGNAGSLRNMAGRIAVIRGLGMGVVAVDYNGYGRSGGSPSEAALELNAEAAWRLAVSRGADPRDIVVWGYSLGGYPAAHLAHAHRRFRNPLMLDSTFTRVADAASAYGTLLGLAGPPVLGDSFDVRSRLLALQAEELMVLHSPDDAVVPFGLGLRNFREYRGGPKEFVVLYGGHSDFDLNMETYREAMRRHLARGRHARPGPGGAAAEGLPGKSGGPGGAGEAGPVPPSDAPGPAGDPDAGEGAGGGDAGGD